MANEAPKTETISFRVPQKMKEQVEKKFKGFEGRKALQAKLRGLYATLLQR